VLLIRYLVAATLPAPELKGIDLNKKLTCMIQMSNRKTGKSGLVECGAIAGTDCRSFGTGQCLILSHPQKIQDDWFEPKDSLFSTFLR